MEEEQTTEKEQIFFVCYLSYSYGVNVESHPRQCIMVATTNNDGGFLRDISGNRRFWPVRVLGNTAKKSWNLTNDDIDEIWAEAYEIYQQGKNSS